MKALAEAPHELFIEDPRSELLTYVAVACV